MKRVRNPSVEDLKTIDEMIVLINYYLEGANQPAYLLFTPEHHAVVNERVKALYDRGGFQAVDFFNIKCHIVPYLIDELKERIIGDCLERKATLYVYPKPSKDLYRRVLRKHCCMHGFNKSRGFCLRSSINEKNVRMIALMLRRAKCYRGVALKKDSNCNILWENMSADFAVDEDYIPIMEIVDEIEIDDVYADYEDEAGQFTGKSRSGFYTVEDNRVVLTLESKADIVSKFLDNRESLVPSQDTKEDGTRYPPKISVKVTEGDSTTQTFCKNGTKQLMDFEKPDALLSAQMEKYGVVVGKKGADVVVTMPTPKIIKSKAGKDISENSFLSHTECEVLVTMSAWKFATKKVKINKVETLYASIGGKFWASRIIVTSDNIGGEGEEDGISETHRDLTIQFDDE